MALLLGLLLVAALAAAFWLLAPTRFVEASAWVSVASPLQVTVEGSRQTLASGNELLAVSGRVINPSGETQPVPPIYAQIRDGNGRILHSWTIARRRDPGRGTKGQLQQRRDGRARGRRRVDRVAWQPVGLNYWNSVSRA